MSPIWGLYGSAAEAAPSLVRFTNTVLGPDVGIAWLTEGKLYAIRAPVYDADGEGELVTFEYRPGFASPPDKPVSAFARVEHWVQQILEAEGQAAIAQSEASLAAGQAISQFLSPALNQYRVDTIGVGMDTVAVALSIGLLVVGGAEILGIAAFLGGIIMLVADGAAYAAELRGDAEAAEMIKDRSFPYRVLASVAMLPDAIWNVGSVIAEAREMGEAAAHSASTAERALADATRNRSAFGTAASAQTAASQRAARYAEIGARAERRASAGRAKLRVYLGAQAASRVLIPPSAYLLQDEVQEDHGKDTRGRLREFLQNLQFHISVIHRIRL